MEAKAIARYVRISPRKVRLVVDLIRGKSPRRPATSCATPTSGELTSWLKVLESAAANAVNNHDMLEDRLYVKAAYVDEGPALKRVLPRARGRADIIKKRTSHITVILGEKHGK